MKKLKKKVPITRRRKKINKLFWFVPSQQLNKLTMRKLKNYVKRRKCVSCPKIFRFKSGLKTHNEDNHGKMVESSNKIYDKKKSPLSNQDENPPSKIEQLDRGKTRDQHNPDDDNSGLNSQKMIIPSTSQEIQQTQRLLHSTPINVPGGSADGMASCLSPLKRRLQTPATNRVRMVNPSSTPVAQALGTPWGPWTRGGPGRPHMGGAIGTQEEPLMRGSRPRMRGTRRVLLMRGMGVAPKAPHVGMRGAPEGQLMRGIMLGTPRGSVMRAGMVGASRGLLLRGVRGTPKGPLMRGIRGTQERPNARGMRWGPGGPYVRGMSGAPEGPYMRGIKGGSGGPCVRGTRGAPEGPNVMGMRQRIEGSQEVLLMRGIRPRMRGAPRGLLMRGERGNPRGLLRPSIVMVPGAPGMRGVQGGVRMRGIRPRMRPRMAIGSGVRMRGVQRGVGMRWDPRTAGGSHVRGMRLPSIRGVPRGPLPGGQMRPIELVDLSDEESPYPMALAPPNPALDRLKSFGILVSCQKADLTTKANEGSASLQKCHGR